MDNEQKYDDSMSIYTVHKEYRYLTVNEHFYEKIVKFPYLHIINCLTLVLTVQFLFQHKLDNRTSILRFGLKLVHEINIMSTCNPKLYRFIQRYSFALDSMFVIAKY